MNMKDLIGSLILALGITLVFQYFFLGNKGQPVATERVRIAPKTDVHRPLNTEIDFWDQEVNTKLVTTQLETDFAKFTFSNEGAALVKAEFAHSTGENTIFIPGMKSNGKEDRSFLVAFDKKTPYYFDLVSKQELDDSTKISYQANFDGGTLVKVFTVYKQKPQVDLHIAFNPNKTLAEPHRLRLIYAAPSIIHSSSKSELEFLQLREDPLFGVLDSKGSIVKKTINSLSDKYWEVPTNFGGLDNYLVNTMISDTGEFAQRGYYSLCGKDLLKVYLEGPDVVDKAEWDLSFYIGPKKATAFALVDPKLDQLLDYGILAPLSKIFLKILNVFNGYVGNFGWAIILLTILIKLLTLPLTLSGEKSSKNVAEMQRKIQYIEQKYRNDPEAMNRARAEIMKKYGPSMGGCLIPMLVQLPVFIALRGILTSSFELYMAPFLWINNLAASDPYYVFPMLFAACMFLQTSANISDPRKKLSSLALAIMAGAMFSGFAAGITLYFFVSNLLNLLQTTLYRRFKKA
jgi:YidC/Oxa1 family membrane protein insertase